MDPRRPGRRTIVLLITMCGALAFAGSASAHAHISPAIATTEDQVYTLVVPTEKEDASTTQIEVTPPSGFSIESVAPAPGWKQEVATSGSGEETEITKVTWSGGDIPPEQAAFLSFFGSGEEAKTYAFKVRQTYSDGEVVNWAGPESADEPAPTIELESSLGGGGGNKTLEIVALAVGGVALVLALGGLLTASGRRPVA
jgi:uncharacterized protein YcnI